MARQAYQAQRPTSVAIDRDFIKIGIVGSHKIGTPILWTKITGGSSKKEYVVDGERILVAVEIVDLDGLVTDMTSYVHRSRPRYMEGFVLVYSVTSRSSFESIWGLYVKLLQTEHLHYYPAVLVGTNCDMEDEREVGTTQGYDLACGLSCMFLETSTKLGTNIHKILPALVRDIRAFHQHQPAVASAFDSGYNKVPRFAAPHSSSSYVSARTSPGGLARSRTASTGASRRPPRQPSATNSVLVEEEEEQEQENDPVVVNTQPEAGPSGVNRWNDDYDEPIPRAAEASPAVPMSFSGYGPGTASPEARAAPPLSVSSLPPSIIHIPVAPGPMPIPATLTDDAIFSAAPMSQFATPQDVNRYAKRPKVPRRRTLQKRPPPVAPQRPPEVEDEDEYSRYPAPRALRAAAPPTLDMRPPVRSKELNYNEEPQDSLDHDVVIHANGRKAKRQPAIKGKKAVSRHQRHASVAGTETTYPEVHRQQRSLDSRNELDEMLDPAIQARDFPKRGKNGGGNCVIM